MPMMFNPQENQQEAQQERRYDPETLRKVTALATRLQNDHHETLTASQMEAIGLEVGLQSEFIHQAIAQLEEEHARMEQERRRQQEEEEQAEQLAEQRRKLHEEAVLTGTLRSTETSATKSEFYSVCAALATPMLVGFLAYYLKSGTQPGELAGTLSIYPRTGMMQMFTLVAPLPLSLIQGFAVGKRRVGFIAAATLILALAPTVPFLSASSPEQYQEILRDTWGHIPEMFLYLLMALPVAGALGIAGAWIRQFYFPFAGRKAGAEGTAKPIQHKEYAVSRPEMVSLLSNMQSPHTANSPNTQLMGQNSQHYAHPQPYGYVQPGNGMQMPPQAQAYAQGQPYLQTPLTPHTQSAVHVQPYAQIQMNTAVAPQHARRTYVSVDVAELPELRQSATLVAVDYSFGQLRAWIEEIVRGCGGELQAGSDGSLLTSFPTDAQAMRAARLMQERLPQFNQSLNRLPKPFRLRCGISAGANGANVPIARSQALLRAADGGDTLISSELGAAALAELGQLTPLPGSLMGDMAFVWRAAADAKQN